MKKFQKITSILLLLSMGVTGLFLSVTNNNRKFSEQERRPLAEKPSLSAKAWTQGDYARNKEKYLADQFPRRDLWLQVKSQTQYVLGQADNNRVYFAKDNYLMEMHPNLDTKKLTRNVEDLIRFTNQHFADLDRQEKSLLLVPTLAGVNPELLPAWAVETDQAALLKTILPLGETANMTAPDLQKVLRENGEADLYFHTDHHWTQKGAYKAFEHWRQEAGLPSSPRYDQQVVTENFRGTLAAKANLFSLPPDRIMAYQNPDLQKVSIYNQQGKMLRQGIYNQQALSTYDPYQYFVGDNQGVLNLQTGNPGGRLLLFKDSYANAFVPFLCPYYSEITMVDLRYVKEPMQELLAKQDYDSLMFLYNLVTFSEETATFKLLR